MFGWRFVRMPSGLLARFSEGMTNFTHYSMTEDVAISYCRKAEDMTFAEAQRMVREAVEDRTDDFAQDSKKDGLSRWRHCLHLIEEVHGKSVLLRTLREMHLRVTG